MSPRLDRIGDVEGEASVAAFVFADAPAVDEHFGDLKHAVEFQTDALARPRGRHFEMFSIPAVADIKPGGGEVGHRKGMRQIGGIPFRVGKCGDVRVGDVAELEFPLAVEIDVLPQFHRRQYSRRTKQRRNQW